MCIILRKGDSSFIGILGIMRKVHTRGIFIFGIVFLSLEILKQSYLHFIVYDGGYDIWYLPFQLCSMPIYLCLLFGIIYWGKNDTYGKISRGGLSLMTFLRDFGLMGGIMALVVREGFVFEDHIILTAYGYVWHIGMIVLALYIFFTGVSNSDWNGFVDSLIVFGITALIAFGMNIGLHKYGDCDMFYISPYHLSSQPIFHDIDGIVGRPFGIIIYLVSMIIGAFICHLLFFVLDKFRS